MPGSRSQSGVSLVSLGGHASSTPFFIVPLKMAPGKVQASLRARRLAASADRMGWEGQTAKLCYATSKLKSLPSQPAIRARPTLAPSRVLPSAGTAELGVMSRRPFSYAVTAVASEGCASDQRKTVPSLHMRCITTASLRASATFAAFTLRRFAIRIAQDRSDDHRPWCSRTFAAW